MILYHLDRSNTFPNEPSKQLLFPIETHNTLDADQYFNLLYTQGIGKLGERYLNPFDEKIATWEEATDTCKNFRIYTIEYVFEIVRLMHFQSLPSRFVSLFACQDIEGLKLWYELLKNNRTDMSNATVKIIKPQRKTHICDARWRDMPLTMKYDNNTRIPMFNPFAYHEWAKRYWNGEYTDNPRIEVLCELPVTVVKCISVHDFFNTPIN